MRGFFSSVNTASHLLSNDAFQINKPPVGKTRHDEINNKCQFLTFEMDASFNRWLVIKMLTQLYRRPAGFGYAFIYKNHTRPNQRTGQLKAHSVNKQCHNLLLSEFNAQC